MTEFDPDIDVDALLRQRAETLAQAPVDMHEDEHRVALLVLALGDERYAVDLDRVQEIDPARQITPVPNTPAFWEGIVNLRGSMYPVLNLRTYLKLPAGGDISTAKVALVQGADLTVGLLVDNVLEIRKLSSEELHPPLSAEAKDSSGVIRAISSDRMSVLDLDALLSDTALVVEEGAAAA